MLNNLSTIYTSHTAALIISQNMIAIFLTLMINDAERDGEQLGLSCQDLRQRLLTGGFLAAATQTRTDQLAELTERQDLL